MFKTYRLHINKNDTSWKISSILMLNSKLSSLSFKYNIDEDSNDFNLRVEYKEWMPVFKFIKFFIALIEPSISELSDIGVEKKDITFWLYYYYDQQCNMEFSSEDLKIMWDNWIDLCISCAKISD